MAAQKRQRYANLRALGLPSWAAQDYSPATHLKWNMERNLRRKSSIIALAANNSAVLKYRQKCKRLYGGIPHKNLAARVRWLEHRAEMR